MVRVLVIGADLNGLVFALTAALRGCYVSVFERNAGISARPELVQESPAWVALGVAAITDAAQMRATLIARLRALPGAEVVFDTQVLKVEAHADGVVLELSGARRMYGADVFTGATDVTQAWTMAQALQTG